MFQNQDECYHTSSMIAMFPCLRNIAEGKTDARVELYKCIIQIFAQNVNKTGCERAVSYLTAKNLI